jgi:hypothetical protein
MWTSRHAHPTSPLTARTSTGPSIRPITVSLALATALALALAALSALAVDAPPAHASEDHLDLPQDSWGAPVGADSLRIVINVPGRTLNLVQGNTLLRSYPVAVGRKVSPTPTGTFRILQKAKDPTWAPKGRPAVPPGPHNPLGPRWMRISPDGYGIHSTNEPDSIGKVRSHGCIRLARADAIELYDLVPLGTRVDIVYRLDGWDPDGNPVRYADCYGTP